MLEEVRFSDQEAQHNVHVEPRCSAGLAARPAEPRGITQPGYTAPAVMPALRPGLLSCTDPTSAPAPPALGPKAMQELHFTFP